MFFFRLQLILALLATSLPSAIRVEGRTAGVLEAFQLMFSSSDTTPVDVNTKGTPPSDPPPQDMMVIGAGFGRTGTTSFVEALKRLGFKPYHMLEGVMESPGHDALWARHAQGGETSSAEIIEAMRVDGFNATTDFPACLVYQDLLRAYPQARVVLTVRGDGSGRRWAQSALSTILLFHEEILRIPFRWLPKLQHAAAITAWLLNNTQVHVEDPWDATSLAAAYDSWNQRVQAAVPKEQLLVFAAQDGWKPLCDFLSPLDESVAAKCDKILQSGEPYPYENEKAKMRAILYSMQAVATVFECAPILVVILLVVALMRRYLSEKGSPMEKQKDN